MNRTKISTSWIPRGVWGTFLLLVGLLLSTCDPIGPRGNSQEAKPGSQSESCVTGAELTAIGNQAKLEAIAENPSGNYCLTKDILLTGNWKPLDTFTGTLDGRDKVIGGLIINDQTGPNVGFFTELGSRATVKNLIFDSPNVSGKGSIGVLVGKSSATTLIENLQVRGGTITGNAATGGLVGENRGAITNSYVTGTVSASVSGGTGDAGGLVGWNFATITNSYTTGAVTSSGGTGIAGGLVGRAFEGTIESSYATGAITGSGTGSNGTGIAGGIVGANNHGIITNSYATGAVSANGAGISDTSISGVGITDAGIAGGLAGINQQKGVIINSYATGTVSVNGAGISDTGIAGGLAGINQQKGTIENSYATGGVSASGSTVDTGGLVGQNWDTMSTITSSYYDMMSTAQTKGIGDNANGQIVQGVSAAANIESILGIYHDNGGTSGATIPNEIFAGWDRTIWTFATGKWPTLAWQTAL